MKAVVVYESFWGNTAAVARAIAEGIGHDAQALTTDKATADVIAGVDLIVAGAPLIGFTLPTEKMREDLAKNPGNPPTPPDVSHPSMRAWLETLPPRKGRSAAFETRIWWSPGSAAKSILQKLEQSGYLPVEKSERFIVTGKYGPLKDGEVERARQWGTELAKLIT